MVQLSNGREIVWPDGKRIAVMVTFDYDLTYLRLSRNEGKELGFADMSRGEYGHVEGLQRILRILDKNEAVGTFFVPGAVALQVPDDIIQIAKAGNEIACHGYQHESRLDTSKHEEEENLVKSADILENLTGIRPVGSRGCWNIIHSYTHDLLAEHGFLYSSVLKDCDYAYPVTNLSDERFLIELPTEHTFDDYTWFFFTFDGAGHRSNYPVEYVFDCWKDSFDELASEGDKIMILKLHPQLIGRASRVLLLDRFLQYAKSHGAWIAPCRDVAAYVEQFEKNRGGGIS